MLAVSFWSGGKGGVGKSTLAYNVAGDLQFRYPDANVVIFDVDPQGTIANLIAPLGELPFKILTGEPKAKEIPNNTDFLIIDYPPGYKLVPKTRKVVMPIGPSFADSGSVVKTFYQLDKAKRHVVIPLNKAERNTIDTKEAIEVIQDIGQEYVPLVYKRAVFVKALKYGMSIFQKKIFGISPTGMARSDIRNLTDTIFDL